MVIVAISGGTGSGKTTLAKKIIDSYQNIKINYLSLDSYYKDFSQMSFTERSKINFDHPDSIDFDLFYQQINEYLRGSDIKTPTYSYKRHKRLKKKGNIRQGDLLIVDGILILLKKSIRDFFDLSIFLKVNSSERLKRRIRRDINERGRSKIEISDRFYNMIKPMHKKYVKPSENFADVVLGEDYDYELIKIKIDQLLNGNHK
jgi:uridine kinase